MSLLILNSSVSGLFAPFLLVSPSSRQDSLGGATIADGTTVDGANVNPANLAEYNRFGAFLSYAPYNSGVNYFNGFAAEKFKFGMLGFQFTAWDSGTIEGTTVDSSGIVSKTGQVFGFSGQAFSFTYARTFFRDYNIGTAVKIVREDLATTTFNTFAADFGISRKLLSKQLSRGFAAKNFGPGRGTTDGTGQTESLPWSISGGASYEKRLVRNHVVKGFYSAGMISDIGLSNNLGVEYTLYEIISIRAGYQLSKLGSGLATGIGAKVRGKNNSYAFDYGINMQGANGMVNRFSLRIEHSLTQGRSTKLGRVVESYGAPAEKRYSIKMKDGTEFAGKVVFESDEKIVLEVPKYGTVVAKRDQISSIKEIK